MKDCIIANEFIFTYHKQIALEYDNVRRCYNF